MFMESCMLLILQSFFKNHCVLLGNDTKVASVCNPVAYTGMKDSYLKFVSLGFGTFCWHNFEHNSIFFSGSIIEHNSLSHEHNKSNLILWKAME